MKQNNALRLATGTHKMSPVPHLHHEARILPVKEHNLMLAEQFFLGAHLPSRPDHHTTAPPPARARNIKATLQSRFGADLAALVPASQGAMTNEDYRAGLRAIHRRAAQAAVTAYVPPVWQAGISTSAAPRISREESRLRSRQTRSTLAQLRSGYSVSLRSYQSRLDPTIQDACPDCGKPGHTTNHLFLCRPTTLTTAALWDDPIAAAEFLGLDAELRGGAAPEEEPSDYEEDDDPPDPGDQPDQMDPAM